MPRLNFHLARRAPRGVPRGPVLGRRAFFLSVAAAAACAALPVPALAAPTVLHVDSRLGSDGNTGTDPDRPLKTLAKARALGSGAVGGTVLRLRAGRTWGEQLEAWPDLEVGSYGEGPRPVISGFEAPDVSWSEDADGAWSARPASEPPALWAGGDPLSRADPGEVPVGSWSFADGVIRVRLPGGTSPERADLRVPGRTWGIFNYSTADGVGISGIEIVGVAKGIESLDNHRWKVSDCRVAECTENGIRIASAGKALAGIEIVANEVGVIRRAPVIDYWRSGISVFGATRPIVDRNEVRTVNVCGIWVDEQEVGGRGGASNQSPVVTRNLVEDCMGGIYVFQGINPDVSRNVVRHGRGLGIGLGGARSFSPYVGYNLIHDIAIAPDRSLYNGFDVNNCPGGVLEHNTVANVSNYSLTLEDDEVPSDGWTVRDNVFDARGNSPHPSQPGGATGCLSIHDGVTRWRLANNCYVAREGAEEAVFERGDAPSPFMGFPAMLGLTGETGAIRTADPMFVDVAAGDFRLRKGSPCAGAGTGGSDVGAFGVAGGDVTDAQPTRIYFRSRP